MRTPISNVSIAGLPPKFVGTAYDIVVKVYAELDTIVQMGTILDRTSDFLFYRYSVLDDEIGRTVFQGPDKNGRNLKIPSAPMAYVNGVRVPDGDLTVSNEGTRVTFAAPVAPGSEIHIACFGYNADGTMYFDPLFANATLTQMLAEITSMYEDMLQIQANTGAAASGAIDTITGQLQTLGTLSTEIQDIYARAQLTWENGGFEVDAVGHVGAPVGWDVQYGDPVFLIAAETRAATPPDSYYASTKSFGTTLLQPAGPWWSIGKTFRVAGGDSLGASFRYQHGGFFESFSLAASSDSFLDSNDCFVEIDCFDSDGTFLEMVRSRSASRMFWDVNGYSAPDGVWLDVATEPMLIHLDAAFARIRLVFANGSGSATGLDDWEADAAGNHIGLVDDVNFYSHIGNGLIEIPDDMIGLSANVQAVSGMVTVAAGHEDQAEQWALLAQQEASAAATSASTAATIEQTILSAQTNIDGLASSTQSSAETVTALVATSDLSTIQRARGNYFAKTTFEDSLFGGWAVYPGTVAVVAVPQAHPLGRSKCLSQLAEIAACAPLGGWIEEDLNGRVFTMSAYVYNESDMPVEMGIEAVLPDGTTVQYFTTVVAGAASSAWDAATGELAQITTTTMKWRPITRLLGTGACYWTDHEIFDKTTVSQIQGMAEAIILDKQTVFTYADEASQAAEAAQLSELNASTFSTAAGVSAGAAASAAEAADDASAAASTSAVVAAKIAALGQSVLDDQYLSGALTDWAFTGSTPELVDNLVFPIGKSYRFVCTPGQTRELYTVSTLPFWIGQKNALGYVVTVDFTLEAGGLGGAGIQVDWLANSTTYSENVAIVDHLTGPVIIGEVTQVSALIRRPADYADPFGSNKLSIFPNLDDTIFGTQEAKTMVIHRVNIRPATDAELNGNDVSNQIAAAITAYDTVVVDREQAIAQSVTTLNSDYQGTKASVTIHGTALSNLSGSVATLDIMTDAGGDKIAGIRATSISGDGSLSTSLLELIADEVIVPGSLTAQSIAANTITANEIAANAITANELAANAVTADKVVAGSVTADKISVPSLSAITATIGLLRTATSGQRMELWSDKILVYDANNVVRVRIGNLSG